VEVTAQEATYTLTDGESSLTFVHHGEPVEVTADETVVRAIPQLQPLPRPTQPAGRAPARRHPDVAR